MNYGERFMDGGICSMVSGHVVVAMWRTRGIAQHVVVVESSGGNTIARGSMWAWWAQAYASTRPCHWFDVVLS